MDTKPSLRATERRVAISRFWSEVALSKFSIFPRNDDLGIRTTML
ncbi:zinc/manganese ABC transporter substrate binding domain protein [Rickettsia amblyommatis str. Darkwater]|nr:zinc/manganese ABC transporter substrate binding domain protein [Rickettsia amblyommatis str. Darkwater]